MNVDKIKKEIKVNILFYGPELSGKATSIKFILKHYGLEKIIAIQTSDEFGTSLFDYGEIVSQYNQWLLKVHIYSVSDKVVYVNRSGDFLGLAHSTILNKIDGIIFIADSQWEAHSASITSWEKLRWIYGQKFKEIPKIIAFNKRDLEKKYNPIHFLDNINYYREKNIGTIYTVAINGEGISNSLESLIDLIFR